MKCSILLLTYLITWAAATGGKNWALLFSGGEHYDNYCFEGNLCHAYQLLHKMGIPDERIVLIMYDDIADNPKNPHRGEIFNNYNHTDMYQGTPLDYTGKEVSADLILAVLKGDRDRVKELIGRVGKVIDSGPDGNIFVASTGHGGKGVLLMPQGKMMSAKDLIQTMKDMHEARKYSKLVFYLSSCHSGSMFEDLPQDIDVYAITASTAEEPAYMNYCHDPDFQNRVCLGDQLHTGWMENTEQINLDTFTFADQSKAIIKAVNSSTPQLFGDLSILNLTLNQLFRAENSGIREFPHGVQASAVRSLPPPKNPERSEHTAPVHTMRLTLLEREAKRFPGDVRIQRELKQVRALMADVDRFFYQTVRNVYGDTESRARVHAVLSSNSEPIRNWDCYEAAIDAVRASCPGLLGHPDVQGYFVSKYSALVNLCNWKNGPTVSRAVVSAAAVTSVCH